MQAGTPRAQLAIASLDLSFIHDRLGQKSWKEFRISAAIAAYRSFLENIAVGKTETPGSDVDEVWHEHILHTQRYADDCEAIFGGFLHHMPDEHTSSVGSLCVPSLPKGALCVPSIKLSLTGCSSSEPILDN
jgi:hypothetical protein